MASERVEPPPEHAERGWHWLQTREHGPIVGLWEDGAWMFCGDDGGWSPKTLAEFDWRYLAPCIPPEPPVDSSPLPGWPRGVEWEGRR